MIQENEVIMLLLGVGVLVFMLANWKRLRRLPASRAMSHAFHLLVLASILTVLEGFFWPGPLNFLEHACYAGSALLLAAWCWRVFARAGGEPR
jgi:uncharacterized membrane protein